MFIRSMDEDDEIQSHPSPDSPSHSSPPPPPQQPPQSQPQPSNQIIVTVAAAPPSSIPISIPLPPQQSSSNLTLALPIQQFSRPPSAAPVSGGTGGSGGGGGREDCWSEGATSVLIDAWGERYMELSRGNLKQKHWKEVADIVSSREDYGKPPKTDIQCKNRIDTVKKKYKIEKQKIAAGCGPSHWPFFERLDRLIGASATPTTATATVSAAESPSSKAVPVGIPVGIRPLPLPFSPRCLQTPPHLFPQSHQQLPQHRQHYHHQQQQPPQQEQLRQHDQQFIRQRQQMMQNFKVRTPPNGVPHLRYNANSSNNNIGSVGGNFNHIHNVQDSGSGSGRPQLQQQFRRMPQAITMVDSDSEADGEEWSNGDSGDSLPPERNVGFGQRKRPRLESKRSGGGGGGGIGKGEENGKGKGKRKAKKAAVKAWGNSVRELTRAILKFGEAYEAAESAKLQHIAEMEKQRMKFAKELELQRMKFMMKTQLQISQFNGNVNGSNNSDSRGGASGGVGVGGESNHHHLHHIREEHLNHDANSDSSN